MRFPVLSTGDLRRSGTPISAALSQNNGGLANGYLQRNNIDPTVGLRFRF